MKIENEGKGLVFYGLHFYPGVAEYAEPGQKPTRVFINEDTIREMDPTMAGCPVFVMHVDDVEENIDVLRGEADGFVSESFYNAADGKHWAKFIITSKRGMEAIAKKMRLSNAYIPTSFGPGGMWNGLEYDQQITGGKYEHLAIVPNPRYEESIIMSPDEFKAYNLEQAEKLKKLSNSKKEGEKPMLSFFKRQKVENSLELESLSVMLPSSKKEVAIMDLIKNADKEEKEKDEPKMANMEHHVEVDGAKMSVNELVEKYKDACMKMNKEDEEEKHENDEDEMDDPAAENESDEEAKEDMEAKHKAEELAAHEEEELKRKNKKKNEADKEAKDRAERLRNANLRNAMEQLPAQRILLGKDQVAIGKSKYGSRS